MELIKMNRNMKIALAIVVVVAIVIAAVAIVTNDNDEKGDTYRIAVVKHNFEPLFIADELGYFNDAGVNVKLVQASSGNDAMTSLAAGHVDLAGFGSDPFFGMIDKYGGDYKYIGRWMMDEGLKGAAALDCPYSFNGDEKGLVGAKIGVNTNVSYYSLLLKYLSQTGQGDIMVLQKDGGYDKDKVNIYHFANDALSGALTTGKVDMIIAGATNINVVERNPTLYKYVVAEEGYKGYMSVGMFSSMDLVEKREGDIKKILNAIDKACVYMNDASTKNKAIDICMNRLNITDKNIMTKYLELAEWGVKLNDDDKDSIESSFEFIVKNNPSKYTGTLKGLTTIDITDYFDYRFVR